jgi:hypothetical protein
MGFGCLVLPVAVAYRSDRLGTIDLPCRRRAAEASYRADRLGTIDLPFDQACRIAMRVDLPRYPG